MSCRPGPRGNNEAWSMLGKISLGLRKCLLGGGGFEGWSGVNLAVSACVLRATTKKVITHFF